MSGGTVDPFAPARLGGLVLRNHLARTAAFEGMSPGGAPGDALVEHHRSMARGGVGLTTVAYCSVSPEGRTYPTQLLMREEIVPGLRRLTDAVHAEGAAAALQLGHCGDFASPRAIGGRSLGPSRRFVTYALSWSRRMTAEDIARVTGDFARAALRAREAGFDAVELHFGHGYLLSQFLCPAINRRRDGFGGDLAGRMRFPLEVLRAVRAAVGPDFAVCCKLNTEDGFAGGLGIDEAVEFAGALEREGATALVPSGGFVSRNPLYMLRGDVPVREMAAAQPGIAARVGLRFFGRLFVPHVRYSDLFFLEGARRIREAVAIPVAYVGGVRTRAQIESLVTEGFTLVALGRPLIAEPDLVARMARGETDRSACEPCNLCLAEMDRGGVRCPREDLTGRRCG
ncbi:MAG TPA: NADH:flavin oxidoreductase [Polyangia bacterium]|nr:NADH:flavin oxidoreductase [Polyangia bacterium]